MLIQPESPIPLGNPIEWTVEFTDSNGQFFDPTAGVQISIEDPNGITTSYLYPGDLTKNFIGSYSIRISGTIRGDWIGVGTGLLPDGSPVTTERVAQKVF